MRQKFASSSSYITYVTSMLETSDVIYRTNVTSYIDSTHPFPILSNPPLPKSMISSSVNLRISTVIYLTFLKLLDLRNGIRCLKHWCNICDTWWRICELLSHIRGVTNLFLKKNINIIIYIFLTKMNFVLSRQFRLDL